MDKTINCFIERMKRIEDIIAQSLEDAKQCRSEEEFLSCKQTMMMGILRTFPLGEGTCPYCAKYYDFENSCPDCPYGKIHKVCFRSDSDYNKIIRAAMDLLEALRNYV